MKRPHSLATSRLLALTTALLAVAWAAAQPPASRSPVPDPAMQARAAGLVKKLYNAEYEEAKKDPAAAQALAATLLRESKATKDDSVLRFAALGQARDLAAGAGDAAIALQAVDELVLHYPVKGLGLKCAALATTSRSAISKEANQAVVEAALALVDEALFDDDYAAAKTLLEAAETAGVKVKSLALYGRVDRRAQEVEPARAELARVKTFADRLTKDATDAEANYQLGRYTCLVRGNWERGLPLLARGNNAAWKGVAERQLARPKDPSAQARVGDECTRLAESEQGQLKRSLLRRALHWYTTALPKLEGLTRVRVEREVRELARVFPSPASTPEIVAEVLRINNVHLGGIYTSHVSDDGKVVLSAGYGDRAVKVWNAKTGKEVRQLVGHTGNVQCLAFSADGKRAATGCNKNQLRIWDLQSGMETRQLFGHMDYVRGVAFLPDGKRLVSVCDDRQLRIWDLASGNVLHNLNVHAKFVNALALNKNGTRAVTAGDDFTVAVWDLVKLQEVRRFRHASTVWAAAISPDGRLVVSSGFDKTVRLWDVESGKELRQLPHPSMVWTVAFTPDGKRVFTGSGQQLDAFKKDGGFVGGVGMEAPGTPPSTDTLVSSIWDVEAGKELRQLTGHTGLVRAISLTADGRFAVSSANDNTIRVWGERK